MSETPAWFEHTFDSTYLDLYAHRDATEAEGATRALLEPLGLQGKHVLDVGCGGGRWSRAVRRRGAWAVGVDLSEPLLRAAQATEPGAAPPLVRGDMRRLPFVTAGFDLVLCMFTSFGYFASPAEDLEAIAEMGRVLRPGGQLVLDFLNAASVRRDGGGETQRQLGPWQVQERRWIEPGDERVVKESVLRSGSEELRYREEVRLWDEPALTAALAARGLVVETRWGGYDASAFDRDRSKRLVLLARRTAPA